MSAALGCKKALEFFQRKGRVCAGNPRGVSCAVEMIRFSELLEVLKIDSSLSKRHFRQAEAADTEYPPL